MKKKTTILPFVVILFAIAGALATNASPKSVSLIAVSDTSTPCQKIGDCDPSVTGTACAVMANTALFRLQLGETCPSYTAEAKYIPLD